MLKLFIAEANQRFKDHLIAGTVMLAQFKNIGSGPTEAYLDRLNQRLLTLIENSGQVFCSNAIVGGKYALRFCIVNFRTSTDHIEAVPKLVAGMGNQAHKELNIQ